MRNAKDISMRIGWLLRTERQQKRWNQTVVAKKVGITQSSYSRFETGELEVTVYELSQVCDALGVDPIAILRAALK